MVTDHIERFTRTGILLKSGQEPAADIIVTATGLVMSPFGEIRLSVDGRKVDPSDTTACKAMMLAGVPNLACALGDTNLSWTLEVDLVREHFCRLLDHMDSHGHGTVEPVLDDPAMERDLTFTRHGDSCGATYAPAPGTAPGSPPAAPPGATARPPKCAFPVGS